MFYQGFDQATIGVGNTKIMKKDMNAVDSRMKSHHTEEGIQGGGVQFNHGKSRVATDTYDKNGMDTFNNDKNSIQAVSHEQSSYWNGVASVLLKEESTTNTDSNSTSTTRGTSSSKEKVDTQFINPIINKKIEDLFHDMTTAILLTKTKQQNSTEEKGVRN